MAVPRNALTKWEKMREFALGLPGATRWSRILMQPLGETAVKVNKKVFVFLGVSDGSYPMVATVKLRDPKAGRARVSLAEKGAPAADLLCDWVGESYRVPRRSG